MFKVFANRGIRKAFISPLIKTPHTINAIPTSIRQYSLQAPSDLGDYEREIYKKLVDTLEPEELLVKDVSGGCGSMFAIQIVSKKFDGLTMVKQHRLVNEVLADDIKQWHGLQLRTKKA